MEPLTSSMSLDATEARGVVTPTEPLPASTSRTAFEQKLTQAMHGGHATGVLSPSSVASHSPALSPQDGGDGLTVLTSPSGPSSAVPAPMLAAPPPATGSADDDVTVEAALTTPPSTSAEQPRTTSHEALINAHEKALHAKENEIVHLRRTIHELGTQLNNALHLLDHRDDVSSELHALKETQLIEGARRNDEVRQVRLELLENRVKYRSMEDQLTMQYDVDVHAKATELLATHTKEVHEDNFELLKEKLLLSHEVTSSRAQYKALQSKYTQLRQETDLDEDAKRQLLQRSVQQKTHISTLRQQIKSYEDNLNAVVAEYDRKMAEQAKAHQAAVRQLTDERDAARRDAMLLRRELAQLRTAASDVLDQRSDLEAFFYTAMDEVRRGVAEERRQLLLLEYGGGGDEPLPTSSMTPASHEDTAKRTHLRPLAGQTTASFLRLTSPERLRITTGPASTSPGPATGGWTVDRKGLPKRIAAASSARRGSHGAAASSSNGGAASARATPGGYLPQISPLTPASSSSSRQPAAVAAPQATSLDATGTMVLVANATPAYLRTSAGPSHGASLVSSDGARHHAFNDSAMRRTESPNTPVGSSSPAPARSSPPLPLLHSLPPVATWKEVKQVDVAQLSWAEKERVIQLLFQRIRQEGRRKAASQRQTNAAAVPARGEASANTPTVPSENTFPLDEAEADSTTFLTQQR